MPSARAGTVRPPAVIGVGDYARYDAARRHRTGVPEIVLGEGKSPKHLVGLLKGLQRRGHGALVSRPTPVQRAALEEARRSGLRLRFLAGGRLVRLEGPIGAPTSGTVAVVTAGTSDISVAEEAVELLREVGATPIVAYDVGVAGLHRLTTALRRLERRRPSVYLVFAGREGALPTVVAGLVRTPVVGVPTSVGYGRGGAGEAALLAMLQSCAPLAVVNIDAAVPAALFALQLLTASNRRRAPR